MSRHGRSMSRLDTLLFSTANSSGVAFISKCKSGDQRENSVFYFGPVIRLFMARRGDAYEVLPMQ
jgi:hypothetical protein